MASRDNRQRLRHGRRACALLATVAVVCGLCACGGMSGSSVVVRVGATPITKATVERWTRIVERHGAFTGFRGEPQGGTPRGRALALLISSNWLIGEAAHLALPVSEEVVENLVAERMQGQSAADFDKQLRAKGQTVAGVEFELRAELALEAIRKELARRAAKATEAQIEAYYRRNLPSFSSPEVWDTDIIEGLPSAAAARAVVKRVGIGPGFARLAFHKEVARTPGVLQGPATKKRVDYAIYAARPGVLSRPMPLEGAWAIFVVRRIVRSRARPFKAVRADVLASFTASRMREVSNAFERDYRSSWTSRTRCVNGYIAAGCLADRRALGVYEDPFLRT